MIKLSRVLEIDRQYTSAHALPGCIGDAYLCGNNTFYSRIRELCLGLGYRYTAGGDTLWQDYQIAPLLCLPEIIRRKLVPYVDNAAFCRRLLSVANPDYAMRPQSLLMNIKRNYVLHESAHCIAHGILSGQDFDHLRLSPKHLFVRMALATESFANAVEWLTWSLAGTATHAFFFSFCSYVDHTVDKRDLLSGMVSEFGFETAFKMALASFLALNAGRKALTKDDATALVESAFKDAGLTGSGCARLAELGPQVFTLSAGFVNDTSLSYFRLLECEAEFLEFVQQYTGIEALAETGLLDFIPPLLSVLTGEAHAPCPQLAGAVAG